MNSKFVSISIMFYLCLAKIILGNAYGQVNDTNHGLFINDWKGKCFEKPPSVKINDVPNENVGFIITVFNDTTLNYVSRYISGINATTYTGNYLADKEFLSYISELHPSLIRFPGGDASNMYFFNGLPDDLPLNVFTFNGEWTDFSDGTADINWKMNTERYYAFLDSVGSKGIITVNYPYARYGTSSNPVTRAASLAAEWVRYDNGRTKFWEVGNESYACWEGGFRIDTSLNNDGQPQYINGELYGEHFKVFADSMRAAAKKIGSEIFIGAVFADDDNIWDGSGKNITKNWNTLLAKELRKDDGSNYADFISVHSYFLNKNEKTPLEIINSYNVSKEIQNFIANKLDEANVECVPLALSEWNIKPPHQTSHVGGLQAVAAFCKMQEIGFGAACYFSLKDHWRAGNGDFGMVSHNDPELPNSMPYPSFFHLYYLNKTIGDRMIKTQIVPSVDSLLCFASSYESGGIGVVIINKSGIDQTVRIDLKGFTLGPNYYWYEVSKFEDGNTWSEKITINDISDAKFTKGGPSENFTKIPAWTKNTKKGIKMKIKGLSANYVLIENIANK